jgi:hypothetical protein
LADYGGVSGTQAKGNIQDISSLGKCVLGINLQRQFICSSKDKIMNRYQQQAE